MNIKEMRYNVVLEGDRNSKIEYLVKKLNTPSRNSAIGLCIDYCYDVMVKGKTSREAIPILYYKDQIEVLKKEQKRISRELFQSTDEEEKNQLRVRAKDIRQQLEIAKEMYKFEASVEGTVADPIEKVKLELSKERNGILKGSAVRRLYLEIFKMQQELLKNGVKPEDAAKFGESIMNITEVENETEYIENTGTDEN